jgi:MoaA/NifB/PqqE/SkfB family radical SAM enzyme
MTGAEELDFLRLLSGLRVPALLLSGGEPTLHPEFFGLVGVSRELGLNVTVSTTGTLIGERAADILSGAVSYAGISIDGPEEIHDWFRGYAGAFKKSVRAVELLASKGCRAGLRVTLARPVLPRLDEIFRLCEKLPVSRICFYHFIPSGRGSSDASLVPDDSGEALAVRKIIGWADEISNRPGGRPPEILTAGGASDGVRVFEYLKSRSDGRLERASELLRRASAAPCGGGILSVRWDGAVFRNQFMWGGALGRWDDIEKISRGGAVVSDECKSCQWNGKICGGRVKGFGRACAARKAFGPP